MDVLSPCQSTLLTNGGLLYSPRCREGVFPEVELSVYRVLGNYISGTDDSGKLSRHEKGRRRFPKASGNGRMVLIGGVAGECPSGGMCRGRRIYAGYRCRARRWGGQCAPGLAWLACSAQQKRLVVPSRAVRGLLLRSAEARSKGKRRACLCSSSTEKGSSRELRFRLIAFLKPFET